MGSDITDAERAARVRAALAFKFPSAGPHKVKVPEQAKALGWDHSANNRAIYRLLDGDARLFDEKLETLVAVTGVPRWFLEHGFAPPVETGETEIRLQLAMLERTLSQRLADLERQMHAAGPGGSTQRVEDEVAEASPDPRQSHSGPPEADDATGNEEEAS